MTTEEKLEEEVTYWKTRCELIEKFVRLSPCDPDITVEQSSAYIAYLQFFRR